MTSQEGEDQPKKGSVFKVILILFGIIEIGLITAALSFIIGASLSADPWIDLDQLFTGYILMGIFAGSLIIVFPILIISFIASKRKAITKTFHNITSSVTSSAADLAPYSASYRPSKSGQVYYCDYCGYEVRSQERECPECSGPIQKGKRVA
ncbi:MAG: hypothetical protein KGD64_06980 [Candidatus Heimdallarchaeota archaeon]|nr:hypothetical protein [Candidatus Heimdallarchaeota archaeon]